MNQHSGPIGDLARTLTYQEFPNYFILQSDPNNSQSKMWRQCQRNSFALGRMIYVGPTAGERFYLRLLLMVVKGPISFEDLRTVDGETCETFCEACLKCGLLEDDCDSEKSPSVWQVWRQTCQTPPDFHIWYGDIMTVLKP